MSAHLPNDYPLALRYMYYLPIAEGSVTELEVQFMQYAQYMQQSAPETALLCSKLFGVQSCITQAPIHTIQDAIEHLAQMSESASAIYEARAVTDRDRAYNKKLEGYALRRQAVEAVKTQIKDAKASKKLAVEQVNTLWNNYIQSLREEQERVGTRSPESFL